MGQLSSKATVGMTETKWLVRVRQLSFEWFDEWMQFSLCTQTKLIEPTQTGHWYVMRA